MPLLPEYAHQAPRGEVRFALSRIPGLHLGFELSPTISIDLVFESLAYNLLHPELLPKDQHKPLPVRCGLPREGAPRCGPAASAVFPRRDRVHLAFVGSDTAVLVFCPRRQLRLHLHHVREVTSPPPHSPIRMPCKVAIGLFPKDFSSSV
jgi:hypothetical protein